MDSAPCCGFQTDLPPAQSINVAVDNSAPEQKRHALAVDMAGLSLSSQSIHADHFFDVAQDVAPALHVSTNFHYNKDPESLVPVWKAPIEGHIYSRIAAPNTTRLEAILSTLLKGPTLTYASGLSAFHAAMVFLNPKRIAIENGYHGIHGVIGIHEKLTGLKKLPLDCPAEELHPGDVVHIETPLNPTGMARNLKAYAEKAHARGAYLIVDATFGPPPLQDPFLWGADLILHSGTKFIGGHSDMLCGVLVVSPARSKEGWFDKLGAERAHLGNVMGSLEGWLGIRSLRTLEIRVQRQSYNAGKLVSWLNDALHPELESASIDTPSLSSRNGKTIRSVLESVQHASLQGDDLKAGWLKKQMPNGFSPVFSIFMKTEGLARKLPSKLSLFHHATSLGGVESLIEWRSMSDSTVDPRLVRLSIGIEAWEDLRDDLLQGFETLAKESNG